MPTRGKALNSQQTEQQMDGYVRATTAAILNQAFGKWDGIDELNGLPYLDGADHIIINGRTATEYLMEQFQRDFPTLRNKNRELWKENQRRDAYGNFRKVQGKEYLSQLIVNHLVNGGKVEVFVPDKVTGKIQDRPMTLTATGSELAGPLVKPRALNGWQKFWSKLGFYKKEKAAVVNYEKEVDARKKVRFCNKAARANLASNFSLGPNYVAEINEYKELREDMAKEFPQAQGNPARLGAAYGFRTNRGSFYATMIEVLATKRDPETNQFLYTNEQLFDVNDKAMRKVRAAAAKEVFDHYKDAAALQRELTTQADLAKKQQDYTINPETLRKGQAAREWLTRLQYAAAGALQTRIDQQARKLNFSQPHLTEQEGFREFALLSDTALDMSQDMQDNQNLMDQLCGPGAYKEADNKVGDCAKVSGYMKESMLAQKILIQNPFGRNKELIGDHINWVMKAQATQQMVGNAWGKADDKSFSEIVTGDLIVSANSVTQQTEYDERLIEQQDDLTREAIDNPAKFALQVADGVLEGRMRVQSIDKDKNVQFEIRDAATVEREMRQQQRTGPAVGA